MEVYDLSIKKEIVNVDTTCEDGSICINDADCGGVSDCAVRLCP